MKIGIYGGSFNPVHWGHIGLARWVVEHTDLDEVWMMVSPNNPLKDKSILADEHVRLEGVKRAIAEMEKPANGKLIKACDFEFGLARPSYTANTLRELVKAYPEHEFTLIIGEDNLAIFDRWREHEYIVGNFRVMVYPRHGQSTNECRPGVDRVSVECRSSVGRVSAECRPLTKVNGKQIEYLEGAPYFDVSSTEIRGKRRIGD